MSEPILTKTTAVAAYGGGLFAFVAGLSANEIAAYGGLLVAVVGLVCNLAISVWFKYQHLKLARQVAIDRPDCATCPERDA